MTGLTPDTIRVWERRHHAVSPERTDGNARRYSPSDTRRLQLLQEVTSLGHPIHSVARLTESELEALLSDSQNVARTPASSSATSVAMPFFALREEYLDAISRYELHRAARLLQRSALLLSRDDFLFRMVLPILHEIGERWQTKKLGVAQEHLVSAQLRGLLQSDLRLGAVPPGAPRMVIATPPGELHEFGALMGAMLATSRGFESVYLGASVPWEEIGAALEKSGAEVVLLGCLRELSPEDVEDYVRGLKQLARRGAEVWVGLPPSYPIKDRVASVRFFDTFAAFDLALLDIVGKT